MPVGFARPAGLEMVLAYQRKSSYMTPLGISLPVREATMKVQGLKKLLP
jgi:hypothetical protein